VIEELDPFFETAIKSSGIACEGKDLFTLQGEYSISMIRKALSEEKDPPQAVRQDSLSAAPGRPPVMCAGCSHKGLFMALSRLGAIVTGDIGCYTLGALPPTNAMDTCVCMGASIGMAHGFDKASDSMLSSKTAAVIGDSTFLHSGIAGLINAVYNQSQSTIIILDNSITGMTGHQQNPGTGMNIRNVPSPAVDLEALCSAIGVTGIRIVDPADTFEVQKVIAEEMKRPCVSVIIARRPCALIPQGKGSKDSKAVVDKVKCTKCNACLRSMCPSISTDADGTILIDRVSCNGCGLCVKLCKFDAMTIGGKTDE
jgi:indolepyruvate ferredoxin oxidoreductase alpha subunit